MMMQRNLAEPPGPRGNSSDNGVAALRAVLRRKSENPAAVATSAENRAIHALTEQLQTPLLLYCRGLTRQIGSANVGLATARRVDAEDLAQEAWIKILRHLVGPSGHTVQDDAHLLRFLQCAARTRLVDLATRSGDGGRVGELDAPVSEVAGAYTPGEQLAAFQRADEAVFLRDERFAPLIVLLWADEAGFEAMRPRGGGRMRSPRQYRALVLYQLGLLYVSEVGDGHDPGAAFAAQLMNRYAGLLGIPAGAWEPVRNAAREGRDDDPPGAGGLHTRLLQAVNAVCGTKIQGANTLAVLRYELNRMAAGDGGFPERTRI